MLYSLKYLPISMNNSLIHFNKKVDMFINIDSRINILFKVHLL